VGREVKANSALKKSVQRVPASKSVSNEASISSPKIQINDEFERSLKGHYNEQKRHPSEVNRLIDELESFDKDLNKSY